MKAFDLSNTKIRISSPKECKSMQMLAFTLGWKWANGQKILQQLDTSYLFFDENKSITHMPKGDESYFYNHHFREITFKELEMPLDESNEDKVMIGYKVKAGVDREAALRAVNSSISNTKPNGCEFAVTSRTEAIARDRGMLDLLFEPVYRDKPTVIEIPYYKINNVKGKDNGILKVRITTNEPKYAVCEGRNFTRGELEKAIAPVHSGVKFVPTMFNIGCYEQFKGILVEDIQKIIDALK